MSLYSSPSEHRSNTTCIHFEQAGFRYGAGEEVLKDLNFALDLGSFHFLVGPSGAGKSSLIKLLYLAHTPTRGNLYLFGQDVTRLDGTHRAAFRRNVGVVFQEFRLLDHFNALDNVALPLRIQGVQENTIRSHAKELLTWVGLEKHLHAYPTTLSGGQKQRIAIARAVISKPKLLIADEPTGNMDDRMAQRLMRLFVELNRNGTTVLIATHNHHLVEHYGYQTLFLHEGRIGHTGTLYTANQQAL